MEVITVILGSYLLLYVGFIVALIYGFSKVEDTMLPETEPTTTFSIVVPFRNENRNLPRLLDSIAALQYPRKMFEVIFVDDFSDDDSARIINQWRMTHGLLHTTVLENLHLTGSPKKDAITRAVPIIDNRWIVTTDADCLLHPQWLLTLDSYIGTGIEMIAGPVKYDGNNSLLHHFQRIDFLSLQASTIGSFGLGNAFMCNGANFAYTKKLFTTLGGFSGSDQIASGDDVFLLQKAVSRFPTLVGYLKSTSAMVTTKPVDSWKALFHQRVRWASKTTSYQSEFGEDLAIAVFVGNATFVTAFILSGFGILSWKITAIMMVVKIIPDMILLMQANKFFDIRNFVLALPASLLYPFFCVAVALYSAVGQYEWKGRKFNR